MELNAFEHDKKKFQEWINSSSYQKRLQERLEVNSACLRDKTSQLLVFQLCREDPIFFIENFGWTYDPRPQHYPHHLPFILFDFQKDVINWIIKHIREGKDGYLDKSRDMGLTWIFIWVFYWYWRFSESFSGLLGSYKEALVDNRTSDSLFGKLDYAIKHTPKWLLPYRFSFERHRQKLKLINPENQNLISGDTMNPDFGRGSRKTVIAFDEAASWEYFREAWQSAGDATSCRLAFTTPKGRNAAALLKESGIDTYSVHWRLHPLKDEKWYEFQKQRRTDEEIAQELDISYHRSQTGRVYPEWDDVEWGYYPYNPDLPLYVSYDFGLSDQTAIVWWQAEGNKVILLDAYSNHGKTIDFYVPFITGVIPSDDYRYTKKDLEVIDEHKNWKKGIHFGDPAGRFRNQVTNKSVIDVLKSYGIVVNFREEAKDFQTRKTETKLLLRNLVVNDNPRTRELGLAMENAHYPSVRRGGQEEVRSIKPVHDWSCLEENTKIRTLNGWKKVKDLEGKTFWTYSYSFTERRLVPAFAVRCWKTHDNAPLLEIGLDNGVSIKATPEHLFLTRNEEWKRAEDLRVGESLMPFYEKNNRGYVRIDLNDGSVTDEHVYVYSRLKGIIPYDYHVDHIDGNKTNNNPENLQVLSPAEHCQKTFRGKTMAERRRMKESLKPYVTIHNRSLIYRNCLYCGKEFRGDHKTFYCSKKCQAAAYRQKNRERMRRKRMRNHKIRFIKRVNPGRVYDIEVPAYHNFVADGVVVHNSHFRSAVEYFAVNYNRLRLRRMQVRDKFPVRQRRNRLVGY